MVNISVFCSIQIKAFRCQCACSVAQSCLTLGDPVGCSWPGSLSMGSPGKNTGVGSHFLLQGVFPTQRSNPGLPHCRQTLYRLSHQGLLRTLIQRTLINLACSFQDLCRLSAPWLWEQFTAQERWVHYLPWPMWALDPSVAHCALRS